MRERWDLIRFFLSARFLRVVSLVGGKAHTLCITDDVASIRCLIELTWYKSRCRSDEQGAVLGHDHHDLINMCTYST